VADGIFEEGLREVATSQRYAQYRAGGIALMAYYLDLFTPDTWAGFRRNGGTISGFRERQIKSADKIKPGDIFLCYLVRVSRWCGILKVTSVHFTDNAPIFSDPDPFTVRFRVDPLIVLDLEQSIPILDVDVWSQLALTKGVKRGVVGWAQFVNLRASLREINAPDGETLVELLTAQSKELKPYPLSAVDKQRIGLKSTVRTADRSVVVEVPADEEIEKTPEEHSKGVFRESYKVQATIARIGAEMGFRIWIPKSDRQSILEQLAFEYHQAFIDVLPLNYDDNTLRTIEQIDVIWMRGRSKSSTQLRFILGCCGWQICWRSSRIWIFDCTLSRLTTSARRSYVRFGGPYFRCWTEVPCTKAAPIFHTKRFKIFQKLNI